MEIPVARQIRMGKDGNFVVARADFSIGEGHNLDTHPDAEISTATGEFAAAARH